MLIMIGFRISKNAQVQIKGFVLFCKHYGEPLIRILVTVKH